MNVVKAVIDCFEKNNVKLMFEDVKNITKAVDEIVTLSSKIHLYHKQKEDFFLRYELKEYDITHKKEMTIKKVYPYSWMEISSTEKIKQQQELIRKFFSFVKTNLFDYDGYYYLNYRHDKNVISSFQYEIAPYTFRLLSDQSIEEIYSIIKIQNKFIEFFEILRKHDKDTFYVSSIECDHSNNVVSVNFYSSFSNFESIRNSELLKHKNLNTIIDFMLSHDNLEFLDAGIEYYTMNGRFSLEIYPTDMLTTINKLMDARIINQEELENYDILRKNTEYNDYSLKFVWTDVDNYLVSITKAKENEIKKYHD